MTAHGEARQLIETDQRSTALEFCCLMDLNETTGLGSTGYQSMLGAYWWEFKIGQALVCLNVARTQENRKKHQCHADHLPEHNCVKSENHLRRWSSAWEGSKQQHRQRRASHIAFKTIFKTKSELFAQLIRDSRPLPSQKTIVSSPLISSGDWILEQIVLALHKSR